MYTDGASTLTTYYFMGGAYEKRTGTTTTTIKYYSFGGQTIMNDGTGLKYFLTDHLGSVVAITNASGGLVSQQRYLPFGQVRTDIGTISQTDLGYTGQRNNSYINLLDYRSRWYDPQLGRFNQPDTIIPNQYNPQALNRYSYVFNRPINLNDPTGHNPCNKNPNSLECKRFKKANDWEDTPTDRPRKGSKNLQGVPMTNQKDWDDCGIAAIVMGWNYKHPNNLLSMDAVITNSLNLGVYFPYGHPSSDGYQGITPAGMSATVNSFAANNNGVLPQSWGNAGDSGVAQEVLYQMLSNNNPVIVDVTTEIGNADSPAHFVVVTGMNFDTNEVTYNDPYVNISSNGTRSGEGINATWGAFWNSWHGNNDPGGSGWWMVIH